MPSLGVDDTKDCKLVLAFTLSLSILHDDY